MSTRSTTRTTAADAGLVLAAVATCMLLARSADDSTPPPAESGVAPRPAAVGNAEAAENGIDAPASDGQSGGSLHPDRVTQPVISAKSPSPKSTAAPPRTGEEIYADAWKQASRDEHDILVILYETALELGDVWLSVPSQLFVPCALPIAGRWNDRMTNGERWGATETTLFRYDVQERQPYGPYTLSEFLKRGDE